MDSSPTWPTRPSPTWPTVAGAAIAVLYVVVAVVCFLDVTRVEVISGLTGSPDRSRVVEFVPYVVVALGLLALGLLERRWWQAPLAPVVLLAGAWWWLTWNVHLPQRAATHHWSPAHASHVADLLYTVWHVVTTFVVILGWGLVRRRGWSWLIGLVPAAIVVGLVEVVERTSRPTGSEVLGSRAAFVSYSHSLRHQEIAVTVLTSVAVVVVVWLCVAAERFRSSPSS